MAIMFILNQTFSSSQASPKAWVNCAALVQYMLAIRLIFNGFFQI